MDSTGDYYPQQPQQQQGHNGPLPPASTATAANTSNAPVFELGELPAFLREHQNPDRMQLTTQERQWALTVKEALQNDPELDDISDFLIAQISLLVEPGNMEEALERAQKLQYFRQEHGIVDSLQAGQRILDAYPVKWPQHLHRCY